MKFVLCDKKEKEREREIEREVAREREREKEKVKIVVPFFAVDVVVATVLELTVVVEMGIVLVRIVVAGRSIV